MQEPIKYAIFPTKWGYFGLASNEYGLLRTCLPLADREKAKSQLLQNLPSSKYDKTLFQIIQEQISAYFEGAYVNFSLDIPIVLDRYSEFCRSVSSACRGIRFGQVITYSALAKTLGLPNTARAIGNALGKNPLPLIIPCHRVVRSDGSLGGFSAPGGLFLKRKLLAHEQKCLSAALE